MTKIDWTANKARQRGRADYVPKEPDAKAKARKLLRWAARYKDPKVKARIQAMPTSPLTSEMRDWLRARGYDVS